MTTVFHAVYNRPLIYDIAFSFRDLAEEADTILAWYRSATGRSEPPRSALELACGPGYHTLELARRGIDSHGLDLSAAMCDYARQKAAEAGFAVTVHQADMVRFDLGSLRYDHALCMIDSLAHVFSVDAMVDHLRSVARHLHAGGVYIIEQSYPGDYLFRAKGNHSRWSQRRGPISVRTTWGRSDDRFDPATQIRDYQVELRVREGEREEVLREVCRMKIWTATEMEACIKLSGAFEIAARYGGFAAGYPFGADAEPAPWRMITAQRPR